MPDVLLDTHIFIWWITQPARLSRVQAATLRDLEQRKQAVALSAISLWEVAKMFELGRLELRRPLRPWLSEVSSSPLVEVMPLSAAIAAESVLLGPGFPKDPADQLIVATARCHGLALMTADERIRRWGGVPVI